MSQDSVILTRCRQPTSPDSSAIHAAAAAGATFQPGALCQDQNLTHCVMIFVFQMHPGRLTLGVKLLCLLCLPPPPPL